MKRRRDLEDKELLPVKRAHIQDDKDKEEDISDLSEDRLVDDFPSENDNSNTKVIASSMQKLSLEDLCEDIILSISRYLPEKDLANLAAVSQTMNYLTTFEREKRAISALLLAVVQGDEAKAKRIGNPALVCSARGMATDYSERLIQNLTPFQAALCAGDVEMCEMMKKDYFSQLEDGQVEIEKQFNAIFPNGVEAHIQTQQDNVFDFNEILQAIIHAPDNEVTGALNKAFDNNLPLHQVLEDFRKAFTEKSLSETVFNPYHLLKAFKTYDAEFDHLGNWDKRNLFWRQVIGFMQRYLPACYLQASAQGIYYIVEDKEPLRRSFDFRWGGGSILPVGSFSDLGFDFAVGVAGCRAGVADLLSLSGVFWKLCVEQKHQAWRNYSAQSSGASANLVCNSLK